MFPYGNNVDFASFYLEQGREEEGKEDKPQEDGSKEHKADEGWYACVHFTLVLWNKQDPSIYVSHSMCPMDYFNPLSLLIAISREP